MKSLILSALTYLFLIGTAQSLKSDQGEFFEFWNREIPLLSEEFPLVEEFIRATKTFYRTIQSSPKGLKFLDSFADVVDVVTNREYNWTMVDLYLQEHEVPPTQDIFNRIVYLLSGNEDDEELAKFQFEMSMIRFLIETDTGFQKVVAKQLLPLFTSVEMKRFVDLINEPSIHVIFIDYTIDLIRLFSNSAIDTLVDAKYNLLLE